MTTCKGQHLLEVVYCHGPEMEETVVRWCTRCGAIVIDVDTDGRTQPGGYMAMRLPETEARKQGKVSV